MTAWHGVVEDTRRLTPGLVRVVLGGAGLAGLEMPDGTDAYVNLAIAPPGAPYDDVFDPAEIRELHSKTLWPARRRYTVRSWDPATGRLTIDFVVHGDSGVAGPWAASARVGDTLVFEGPSGGYQPDPDADWHLFVGDESALPAIAVSLEAVPADTLAVVRLVCDGPEDEVELTSPGRLDLQWLHRSPAAPAPGSASGSGPGALAQAVRDLTFPAGRVHAFVHGEADEIREVRRHLLVDRALARSDMSCSPYWRRTMSDEAWRQVKRDYVSAMEADTP